MAEYRAGEFANVPNIPSLSLVTPPELMVFVYLCWRAGKDKNCFPSYATIEKDTSVSKRTAIRAIQKLEELGWVKRDTRERDNGSHASNNYRIMQVKSTKKGSDTVALDGVRKDTRGSVRNDTPLTITNKNNNHLTTNVEAKPKEYGDPTINEMFRVWEQQLGFPIKGKIKQNRNAASTLIKSHGKDNVLKLIAGAALALQDTYAPRISDFISLQAKQNDLLIWGRKSQSKNKGVTEL